MKTEEVRVIEEATDEQLAAFASIAADPIRTLLRNFLPGYLILLPDDVADVIVQNLPVEQAIAQAHTDFRNELHAALHMMNANDISEEILHEVFVRFAYVVIRQLLSTLIPDPEMSGRVIRRDALRHVCQGAVECGPAIEAIQCSLREQWPDTFFVHPLANQHLLISKSTIEAICNAQADDVPQSFDEIATPLSEHLWTDPFENYGAVTQADEDLVRFVKLLTSELRVALQDRRIVRDPDEVLTYFQEHGTEFPEERYQELRSALVEFFADRDIPDFSEGRRQFGRFSTQLDASTKEHLSSNSIIGLSAACEHVRGRVGSAEGATLISLIEIGHRLGQCDVEQGLIDPALLQRTSMTIFADNLPYPAWDECVSSCHFLEVASLYDLLQITPEDAYRIGFSQTSWAHGCVENCSKRLGKDFDAQPPPDRKGITPIIDIAGMRSALSEWYTARLERLQLYTAGEMPETTARHAALRSEGAAERNLRIALTKKSLAQQFEEQEVRDLGRAIGLSSILSNVQCGYASNLDYTSSRNRTRENLDPNLLIGLDEFRRLVEQQDPEDDPTNFTKMCFRILQRNLLPTLQNHLGSEKRDEKIRTFLYATGLIEGRFPTIAEQKSIALPYGLDHRETVTECIGVLREHREQLPIFTDQALLQSAS